MTSSGLITRTNPVDAASWHEGRSWVTNGRGVVDCITIHVTQGSAASVRAFFAEHRPDNPTSAHYLETISGGTELFVDEDDTAYHAGQLVDPSHPLVRARYADGKYSPNSYSIGIEHEGDGTQELTGPQRAASLALMADIHERRGVPIDRTHIFAHHEVKKTKPCPGAISVDRLVAELLALVGAGVAATPPVATPAPLAPVPDVRDIPAVVYSPRLGWLVPITVTSDTVWTFATVAELRAAVRAGRLAATMEAGTPLSAMPRRAP
jgi:hypothetical protein